MPVVSAGPMLNCLHLAFPTPNLSCRRSLYSETPPPVVRKASMAGIDVVLIYADREHFANMAYLTGFETAVRRSAADPGSGKRTGGRYRPENHGYAAISPLDLKLVPLPPVRSAWAGPTQDPSTRRHPERAWRRAGSFTWA